MKHLPAIPFVIFLVAALSTASARTEVFRDPTISYSGSVTAFTNGVKAMNMKVYYAKSKVRMDLAQKGRKMVVIVNHEAGIQYILMLEKKGYIQTAATGSLDFRPGIEEAGTKIEKVGQERINGVLADKFKVVGRLKEGGNFDGFVWQTQSSIFIRMEGTVAIDGKTFKFLMNLTDLRVGPQDPELFRVPSGFRMIKP